MTLRIRLMAGVDRRCATIRHRDSTARPRALSRSRMHGRAPARGPRWLPRPIPETKRRCPARLGASVLREQPPRLMTLSPERPRRRRNPRRHGDAVPDANCDADKAGSALLVVTRSTTSRPRCRGKIVLHDDSDRMRTLNAGHAPHGRKPGNCREFPTMAALSLSIATGSWCRSSNAQAHPIPVRQRSPRMRYRSATGIAVWSPSQREMHG